MIDEDLTKEIALMDEVETSIKLIKLGLGELQNFGSGYSFYYLPFQLLSSGFERFMKCYICLAYKNEHGSYPEYKYLKNIGHDLLTLLANINVNYFIVDNRPVVTEDKEFLIDDEFIELFGILSEFGKIARYHNLDVITGSKNMGINPKDEWQKFENEVLKAHPKLYEKLLKLDENYEVYNFISTYIIKIFEKFMASLCRQFMFGHIGDKAKQFIFWTADFGMIYEKNLGTTDYRKNTTKYKETPRKAHKRTANDEWERTHNKNFKSKKILQSEYSGDWPFYTDEIIIECRDNHWCIVTIEGYDYALNGSAKSKYKIDDPHEGGVSIPGKTFTEFIAIAKNI